MINEDLLDFSNSNLLDSDFVGRATVNNNRRQGHRRERYSNAVDVAAIVASGATLGSAGLGALGSRQPNVSKQQARGFKKELKAVCGRRPLLKKKRGNWDECVKNYLKSKQPTVTPVESSQNYKPPTQQDNLPSSTPDKITDSGSADKKILGMSKSVAIPVIVGASLIIGFIVYKKFFAKGTAAVAAAPAVG